MRDVMNQLKTEDLNASLYHHETIERLSSAKRDEDGMDRWMF